MTYTKAQLIDQVYLKLTGGKPSTDIKVWKADIEKYLAAAVNYVIIVAHRSERKEVIEDFSMSGVMGSVGVVDEIASTYTLDIQKDAARGLRYLPLSKKVQWLGGKGFKELVSLDGTTEVIPVKSYSEVRDMCFGLYFWLETVNGEQRLYLKNVPDVVTQLIARYVVSTDDLSDDDLIPLPSMAEVDCIDLMVKFFFEQRQIPRDEVINQNDEIRQ